MMMMMIMSTFIAHNSINLNAQCAEGRGGGGVVVVVVVGGGGGGQ